MQIKKGIKRPLGVVFVLNNMTKCDNIVRYMRNYMIDALSEAEKAYACDEIPIGAVVEKDGIIIGRGHNLTETLKDPTAHAEMIAIREAAKTLGGWRLLDCNLYVTCEPCTMCAGAIVWSRMKKVFIGTMDPKGGACGSVFNIIQEERLNHFVEIEVGLMEAECSGIMKAFFKELRRRGSKWDKQKDPSITK